MKVGASSSPSRLGELDFSISFAYVVRAWPIRPQLIANVHGLEFEQLCGSLRESAAAGHVRDGKGAQQVHTSSWNGVVGLLRAKFNHIRCLTPRPTVARAGCARLLRMRAHPASRGGSTAPSPAALRSCNRREAHGAQIFAATCAKSKIREMKEAASNLRQGPVYTLPSGPKATLPSARVRSLEAALTFIQKSFNVRHAHPMLEKRLHIARNNQLLQPAVYGRDQNEFKNPHVNSNRQAKLAENCEVTADADDGCCAGAEHAQGLDNIERSLGHDAEAWAVQAIPVDS